jgi:hypothetical protein
MEAGASVFATASQSAHATHFTVRRAATRPCMDGLCGLKRSDLPTARF